MKRTILIILLLVNKVLAQNLIPNPGFETFAFLPSMLGEFGLADGWNNCNGGGSPSYFSGLGSGPANLPNCFLGTENAHGGNGCMGAALYYYTPNYRDYIDVRMTSSMTVGTTYAVSFYISNGVTTGVYGGGGINEISVAFSTSELKQNGTGAISFTPQFIYDTILYTPGWKQISFQFIADSAYNYFTLGNFKSDSLTQYQQFDSTTNHEAYYFYDDISVQEIAAAPPVAAFSAADTMICASSCIGFNNLSTAATSWHWFFPGANPSTDTSANPQTICYPDSGSFNVTLVASNSTGSDTLEFPNYISVYAPPPLPVIRQSNDTLFCNTDSLYTSYQWYNDSAMIPGATDTLLVISNSGNYNIQVANKNGCKTGAGTDIALDIENYTPDNFISLSPNPAKERFKIYNLQFTIGLVGIYNILGQVCEQSEITNPKSEIVVDISNLPAGVYFVQLTTEKERWVGRFVKE